MAHKLGIIGYGGMGSWHHHSVSEKVDGLEVVAVYDIRSERREAAAKEGLLTYDTLEGILGNKEIDFITVATPNNFHRELVTAALRAGKNTVSEKPVTLNAAELEDIIKARDESGKLFAVHQNRRWDRDFRIVRKAIADGLVGRPFFIESRVQGSSCVMHGWRGARINGGGMLYDWGVHLIDQMMWLIDSPVEELYCDMKYIFNDECDDNFKLQMRFANGISAHVQVDTCCFVPLPRWQVQGDGATLVVEDWGCKGRIVRALETGTEWSENIVYTEAGPTRTMAPRRKETIKEEPLPEVQTDWSDYYKNLMDVVDNGAELIVKPEQSLRVMKVIDAAFLSAKTGKSVSGPF